ncbi:MAG: hypothetical protein M0P49_04890 [Bacilli bacterium]|nr:hypothetical protein [Bacilli bacterium]
MSDKIRDLSNMVTLAGKITEIEVKKGKNKNLSPDIKIKGEIQFGDTKAQSRKFETYIAQYNAEGKENKLYDMTLPFVNSVKSVAKVGEEEATLVSIQGGFKANDYVNKKDILVEGLKIDAKFFNDFTEYQGLADIEGYIQSIVPEVKGEEEKETGRLRVTLITTDFFGNIIPVKNIIVPADIREAFEENYQVGQTAKLFVDFVVNKADEKPVKTGGIGKQRVTQGKSYVEMILTGADPAFDEDDDMGISSEAIRIALSERKALLNDIKDKGYQGGAQSGNIGGSSSNRKGLGSNKPAPVDDDDSIPF